MMEVILTPSDRAVIRFAARHPESGGSPEQLRLYSAAAKAMSFDDIGEINLTDSDDGASRYELTDDQVKTVVAIFGSVKKWPYPWADAVVHAKEALDGAEKVKRSKSAKGKGGPVSVVEDE